MNPAVHEYLSPAQQSAINRAFSKQSDHYDIEDSANPILQDMRRQVYAHVQKYLEPDDSILELNAGTGIDALYFARQGHRVHATDISTGMIRQIKAKIESNDLQDRVTCQQVSYDKLIDVSAQKFDYVFSNFGGLNCIQNLSDVTRYLPSLLNAGAHITFVIMPPVYLWELLWIFKGDIKQAFRRLHKNGVEAHLEGEFFKTYYHSLQEIKKAFPPQFKFIRAEGLCCLSPPPSPKEFALRHPRAYRRMRKIDSIVRLTFPFNRWADHLIVTFKLVN